MIQTLIFRNDGFVVVDEWNENNIMSATGLAIAFFLNIKHSHYVNPPFICNGYRAAMFRYWK